jgi:streptomycin 6-kinase
MTVRGVPRARGCGTLVLMEPLSMPSRLVAAAREEGRDGWLDLLPGLVAEAARRWSVTVGPPFEPGGVTAWVAPARGPDGADLVLKVVWPHEDAAHEAAGLRAWDGRGAVRLHDAARLDGAEALLLERCRPGVPLSTLPEPEQDVVVAGVLRRLWAAPIAADAGFPTLVAMCDRWAGEYERAAAAGRVPLDDGLARAALSVYRSLPRTAEDAALLATDLHAGNVLSATRNPWLAIDPKPHVGDPAYDATQHMLNCDERLHADPDALVARLAGLLDLDPGRLRMWLFARCAQESPGWPGLAAVALRLAP